MKKHLLFLSLLLIILFASCKSTNISNEEVESDIKNPEISEIVEEKEIESTLTILFTGDLMAHNVNYNMSDYSIIWDGVRDEISSCDLVLANIEAPIDTTKEPSSYPAFNMPKKYVQEAINAGFNVFSLCNNHTNDQGRSGILHTIDTTEQLTLSEAEKNNIIYFSGTKRTIEEPFTYNLVEKNDWKILFLPITEILNTPQANQYINYLPSTKAKRDHFIEFVKQLREENPCDLFVLSVHANETEYIRTVTQSQEKFYQDLLEAGVDVVWANHAHIIKDRKVMINSETNQAKIIMYANGNVVSGQRTSPNLKLENPITERDNTGDGIFYKVTFKKTSKNQTPVFVKSDNLFTTVYKTPTNRYVVEFLNDDFFNKLREENRNDWANYAEKRLNIDKEYTKEIIEWQ